MRSLLLLISLLASLTSTVFAESPSGDWQTVQQDIPRGWQITVVTSFTFPCVFQQATDQELICYPLDRDHRGSNNGEIQVHRDRIHEYGWNNGRAPICSPGLVAGQDLVPF